MVYIFERKSIRAEWIEDRMLNAIKSVFEEKAEIREAARVEYFIY